MNKILLAALALSLAATSAMAAPRHHMNSAPTPQAGVVVQEGTVIGQDPDGYVRLELLRTAASPNQG